MQALRIAKLVSLSAALLFWLTPSVSQAGPCSATASGGSVTNSTTCGEGDAGENPSDAGLDSELFSADWIQLDKNDPPVDSDDELTVTSAGLTSGTWAIDLDGDSFNTLVLILKDGTPPPGGDSKWQWFVIDQSFACADTAFDFCGTWEMWKNAAGALKQVSHLELWAEDSDTPTENPEPATLLLLGLGLTGLAAMQRRRRRI